MSRPQTYGARLIAWVSHAGTCICLLVLTPVQLHVHCYSIQPESPPHRRMQPAADEPQLPSSAAVWCTCSNYFLVFFCHIIQWISRVNHLFVIPDWLATLLLWAIKQPSFIFSIILCTKPDHLCSALDHHHHSTYFYQLTTAFRIAVVAQLPSWVDKPKRGERVINRGRAGSAWVKIVIQERKRE